MNRAGLSESDLCDKVIRPAIVDAGWHTPDQIYAQYPLRAGRVVVRGKAAKRDQATVLFADFVLFFKPNIPLAVVEAKKSRLSMSAGMQQAINYAELLEVPHMLCVTNLMLHGIEVPSQVVHGNTLARPLRDYTAAERVDVVLTNPPFGGVEEPGIEQGYPADVRTKETADLFLVLIKHILKVNGRAALVLPDGTLFGEGAKTRIKEQLLAECNLHTIVRLPNGVFAPYTGIKTNLLFFTKGTPTQHVWYYEHPYPAGVKNYNKTKPSRIEEFDAEKAWWGTEADGFASRTENERAWRVSIDQIKAAGYNLDQKNPHAADAVSHDPEQLLADYARLQGEAQALRDELRDILAKSLDGQSMPLSGTIKA